MNIPVCDGTITVDAMGVLQCSGAWSQSDYSPLFPPITEADAGLLLTAVLTLWVTAFVFRAVIKSIDARY